MWTRSTYIAYYFSFLDLTVPPLGCALALLKTFGYKRNRKGFSEKHAVFHYFVSSVASPELVEKKKPPRGRDLLWLALPLYFLRILFYLPERSTGNIAGMWHLCSTDNAVPIFFETKENLIVYLSTPILTNTIVICIPK